MGFRNRDPGCSLFVSNLSWSTTWQGLKDHFAQIGGVAYADVHMEGPRRSKGTGVVVFDSPELAQEAIESLNGSILDGRDINVRLDQYNGKSKTGPSRFAKPPQSSHITRAYEGGKGTTVFVENLPYKISWHDLKDFFAQAGNVVVADIFMDKRGLSKGCGVVRYESADVAEQAVEMLNGMDFNGRVLAVRMDQQADKFRDGVGVHVSNLPFAVTWKELKDTFRPMGDLMHAEVATDHSGRSRGWGLVRFANMESAQKAIDDLDGYTMGDRQIAVRLDHGGSD